jgi:hypothetical protein
MRQVVAGGKPLTAARVPTQVNSRRAQEMEKSMSNTARLVVTLALTAVTATGALAASRHRGVQPRVDNDYAYANAYNAYPNPYNAYPNLAEPTGGRAYGARAYWWGANAPAYNAYPNLGP